MKSFQKQVSSLEPSKRLKELGVKQESLFWHCEEVIEFEVNDEGGHYTSGDWNPVICSNPKERSDFRVLYSAFTVAELGEMLPYAIEIDHEAEGDPGKPHLFMVKTDDKGTPKYKYYYSSAYKEYPEYTHEEEFGWYESEANARAKMLIYLIENKFIKVTDL